MVIIPIKKSQFLVVLWKYSLQAALTSKGLWILCTFSPFTKIKIFYLPYKDLYNIKIIKFFKILWCILKLETIISRNFDTSTSG